MPKLEKDENVRINEAAKYLGVCCNTLRNWGRNGKIPSRRNPVNNYRLFRKADLEELLRQIEESGMYPTGWRRSVRRNRKPR